MAILIVAAIVDGVIRHNYLSQNGALLLVLDTHYFPRIYNCPPLQN